MSPDHVYLDSRIDIDEFTRLVREAVVKYFGEDPQKSKHYSRIINSRHHKRLVEYRDPADHGGRNLLEGMGGQTPDETDLYIPPTIVLNPTNDKCMLLVEEVFGPVLPVIQYDDLDQVLRKEAQLPNPLALYIFSGDDAEVQKILNSSRSGGVCVNDCITHMLAENLPFGGLGESGYGELQRGMGIYDVYPRARGDGIRCRRIQQSADPRLAVKCYFHFPREKSQKKVGAWYGTRVVLSSNWAEQKANSYTE